MRLLKILEAIVLWPFFKRHGYEVPTGGLTLRHFDTLEQAERFAGNRALAENVQVTVFQYGRPAMTVTPEKKAH